MRRPAAPLLLFAAAFVVVLLARLPLRFVTGLLPKALQCTAPEGSLWNGHCANLAWSGAGTLSVGAVDWSLHPLQLLRGRVAADVEVQRGPAHATAFVARGFGQLEVRNLVAQGPLDPALMKGFPPGWSGAMEIQGGHVRIEHDKLAALDGDLVVRQLVAHAPQETRWGSYHLRIPPRAAGGIAPGEIQDLDGPLQLRGTLQIAADSGWQLDAGVAPRPGADLGLAQSLEMLGSPDAGGLRHLSVAGQL